VRFPTIEVRVGDVCPRLEDATAIVALVRTLVAAIAQRRISEPRTPGLSRAVERDIISGNEWRCAQHGLDADVIDSATGRRSPVRDAVRALVAELMPTAES